MTKDEVADFVWSRLSKADANHDNFVTKDELKAFARQQFEAMRTEHREKAHKPHEGHKTSKPAAKPAKDKPKSEAKPDTKAEATPELKSPAKPESKAEAKPELKRSSKPAETTTGLERVKDPKTGTPAT